MPKFHPEAPDLVVGPDGRWAAELIPGELRVYDLSATPSENQPNRLSPLETMRQEERSGRIFFVQSDRLMQLSIDDGPDHSSSVVAELWQLPQLTKIGRSVRVPGAVRILGGGAGGVVVAPSGTGAELVMPRESDLVVYKLFVRGEALSAGATPDRRILIEQRGIFEIWDAQTRRAMAKLMLNTRQAPLQLGFIGDGKLVWALTSAIPMRVEVFRASDGLRLFELEQPGRGLCADTAPGRLVIGFEDQKTISYLDLDVTTRSLRRVPMPEGSQRPLGFVVSPSSKSPELLVRLDEPDWPLLRLPLTRITTREAVTRPGAETRGSSSAAASAAKPVPKPDPTRTFTRALRDARPESRLLRRIMEAESHTAAAASKPIAESAPEPAVPVEKPHEVLDTPREALPEPPEPPEPPTQDVSHDSEDEEPVAVPLVPEIALGGPLLPPPQPARASRASREPHHQPLKAYDAQRSPAAWQWELARWAQSCLQSSEAQQPPQAGPLHELAGRLALPVPAQRVLRLLYAGAFLLGKRPRGMRPIELALALSGQCEEPDVLSELLPSAPLRTLDLLVARGDGRLMLRREVALRLSGTPDPLLQWSQSTARELLQPGLYFLDGPCVQKPARLLGRPVLRLDGLSESAPHKVLPSLLRRALVYDAALVIDGLAGLSYPALSAPTVLAELLPLLSSPRVPVVLWAMPEAGAAMGLLGRKLSEITIVRDGPAPSFPSSALPAGVLFRPPSPAAKSATVTRSTGQITVATINDRRAALLLGPSANAESYSRAAYLAARDGAVLVLEAELTPPRIALLALLLKQIPVVVAATPPGGADQPWPVELRPYGH